MAVQVVLKRTVFFIQRQDTANTNKQKEEKNTKTKTNLFEKEATTKWVFSFYKNFHGTYK